MMAALLAPSERTFVVLVSTTPKQGRRPVLDSVSGST